MVTAAAVPRVATTTPFVVPGDRHTKSVFVSVNDCICNYVHADDHEVLVELDALRWEMDLCGMFTGSPGTKNDG